MVLRLGEEGNVFKSGGIFKSSAEDGEVFQSQGNQMIPNLIGVVSHISKAASASYSPGDTNWHDITGMTETFTLEKSGVAFIIFSGKYSEAADIENFIAEIRIVVDSVAKTFSYRHLDNLEYVEPGTGALQITSQEGERSIGTNMIVNLSKGEHTISIQAKFNDGSASFFNREMDILVFRTSAI